MSERFVGRSDVQRNGIVSGATSIRDRVQVRVEVGSEVSLDGYVWTIDEILPGGCTLRRVDATGEHLTRSITWVGLVDDSGLALRLLRTKNAGPLAAAIPDGEPQGYIAARLWSLNLLTKGYVFGSPAFALPGEPRPGLEPPTPQDPLMPRCERLSTLLRLATPDADPILYAIREGMQRPTNRATSGDRRHGGYSAVSLYRLVRKFEEGGGSPTALVSRRGRSTSDESDRRAASKFLVEEVVAADHARSSRMSDALVVTKVHELATERGLDVVGRTELQAVVTTVRRHWGRTPGEKRTARMDASRLGRASRRPLLPGEATCIDVTPADVLVTSDDGKVTFRVKVVVGVDAATGAPIALIAGGHERGEEIVDALRDSMRPLVFDTAGLPAGEARLRPVPRLLELGDRALEALVPFEATPGLKPGVIPSALRTDNARANQSAFVLSQLAALGIDLRPSRVGYSMGNSQAEGTFNALNKFMERLPGYVGRHSRERGADAGSGELLTVSVLRRRLQAEHQDLLCVRDRSYTIEPGVTVAMTPLQAWDRLCSIYGYQPILNRAEDLFPGMPARVGTLNRAGIKFSRQRYDSDALREAFPYNGVEVRYWYDRRTLDHIWVRHPVTTSYFKVPNVLHMLTDRPLVQDLLTIATRRIASRVDPTLTGLRLMARAVEQVLDERADGKSFGTGLEADLVDHQIVTERQAELVEAVGDLVMTDAASIADNDRPRYLNYRTTG